MNSVYNKGETLQQKSKRLSIDLPHQNDVTENPIYINKKNPASFNVSLQLEHSDSIQNFQILISPLQLKENEVNFEVSL